MVEPEADPALIAQPAVNLKEIRLPPGDVGSITVGWTGTTGEAIRLNPNDWLSQGYAGVRLIGDGSQKVRCTSWDGCTLKVARHEGIVSLEGVELHAGYSRATLIGAPDKTTPLARKFGFRFLRSKGFVPEPQGDGRTTWLLMSYNADMFLEDVELDATFASEHASYEHGHANYGSLWRRVRVVGSGGENDKVRSDATETLWAGKQAWIIREDCRYAGWYQTWSNRGGAASVRQGSGCNNSWKRCTFYCGGQLGNLPAHQRSRTIMVTAEGDSYDALTGEVDKAGGFGNNRVEILQCGASAGGPGTENLSLLARVGVVAGPMQAATSFTCEGSGLYGQRYQLQMGNIPAGKTVVRNCNTQANVNYLHGLGMDTTYEAVIALHDRVIPISQGYTA